MESVRIVVDVMGGDEEPRVVLDGIAAAVSADPGLTVVAVGPEKIVGPFAAKTDRVEPLAAPDVITMEDEPIQAVMKKRRSSVVIGLRAVKRGDADGFFSAGPTGSIASASKAYVTPVKYDYSAPFLLEPIRPCLTSALPNRAGGLTFFCDMGANPDVGPVDIVRFAQMGAAYARAVCGIENPRVGLLSNGSEDTKGSHFTKECFPLMREQVPGFKGNCEGVDLTSGDFDVVVADGFAGNVALKATEGAAKFLMSELKGVLMGSAKGKIAALLIRDGLSQLKSRLSGDAKGGAVLLGLRGVVLIGHGATSVEAVRNGTLAAAEAVRGKLIEHVAASMDNII